MGINVDLPPEALSVSGNVHGHLTGQLLQLSDKKIKHSIAQVNSEWVGGAGGSGHPMDERTLFVCKSGFDRQCAHNKANILSHI